MVQLSFDQYVYFAKASDFTSESFGTLVFDFSININADTDQGWVYGVYSVAHWLL